MLSSACRPALWLRAVLIVLLMLLLCVPTCTAAASLAAVQAQSQGTLPLPTLSLSGEALSAHSALLMDAGSGQVYFAKNAQEKLPMASTTKVMTALCAAELYDLDRMITVAPAAVGIEGSSVYLQAGERLTLRQLLYALLLSSANDAAVAIAIGVSGSVEAFVAQMNQKAASLGLTDTHFDNPHGLYTETHYTTAYDLACITREALAHPTLAAVMSTRKITIPAASDEGVRYLINHNKMLQLYQGAVGGKTGFTKKSGRCLVSAAEREGLTLIAVTLGAPDDWNDHTKMLDAGFATYESVQLCDEASYSTLVPVSGGVEDYVLVRPTGNCTVTLPRNRGSMTCTVELPRFLFADVAAGESVGQLIFACDIDSDGQREVLCRLSLATRYAVERKPKPTLWERLCARLRGEPSRNSS